MNNSIILFIVTCIAVYGWANIALWSIEQVKPYFKRLWIKFDTFMNGKALRDIQDQIEDKFNEH